MKMKVKEAQTIMSSFGILEKALLFAGIQTYRKDEKNGRISFELNQICQDGVSVKSICVLQLTQSCLYIIEYMSCLSSNLSRHNLERFLERRNKVCSQNERGMQMQYKFANNIEKTKNVRIALYSRISLNAIQEKRIIYQIGRMNHMVQTDYPEIRKLCSGVVSDTVKESINNEYLLCKNEWREGM